MFPRKYNAGSPTNPSPSLPRSLPGTPCSANWVLKVAPRNSSSHFPPGHLDGLSNCAGGLSTFPQANLIKDSRFPFPKDVPQLEPVFSSCNAWLLSHTHLRVSEGPILTSFSVPTQLSQLHLVVALGSHEDLLKVCYLRAASVLARWIRLGPKSH